MKVLIGIGGEQDIGPIAAFASALQRGTELFAVAVVPRRKLLVSELSHPWPYPWKVKGWRRSLKNAEQMERVHAEQLLESLKSMASAHQQDIRTVVVRGDPARQLLSIARKENCDFIVVGRHQGASGSSPPLGHVASRVARYARCSVLVLDPSSPVPRICLFATDGSARAGVAGARLRSLYAERRRTLVICAVVPVFSPTFVKTGSIAFEDYEQFWADVQGDQRAAAQAVIDNAATEFQGTSFVVKKETYNGDEVSKILKAVTEHHVDLLVMGSKGISEPSRYLLGSVSLRLLNRSPCSILIGR